MLSYLQSLLIYSLLCSSLSFLYEYPWLEFATRYCFLSCRVTIKVLKRPALRVSIKIREVTNNYNGTSPDIMRYLEASGNDVRRYRRIFTVECFGLHVPRSQKMSWLYSTTKQHERMKFASFVWRSSPDMRTRPRRFVWIRQKAIPSRNNKDLYAQVINDEILKDLKPFSFICRMKCEVLLCNNFTWSTSISPSHDKYSSSSGSIAYSCIDLINRSHTAYIGGISPLWELVFVAYLFCGAGTIQTAFANNNTLINPLPICRYLSFLFHLTHSLSWKPDTRD